MPVLAISCMNQFLHAVEGDVLSNPFEFSLEIHEELALVSLQARVRQMAEAGVGTCSYGDLRPGVL